MQREVGLLAGEARIKLGLDIACSTCRDSGADGAPTRAAVA